jgi:hypothetical protein
MFERYTEKARRVIFFARYEASQFGASQIELNISCWASSTRTKPLPGYSSIARMPTSS